MQLTRQKKATALVGLDIEAGSVAATEVKLNGSAQLGATAIEPLAPGAFHEGEVADADSLAEALKSLFSKHKLSKRVRLGIGNQGVVVRTVRLPAIEDPKELDAAVRFQAQEQMPMPLDQAVLEHQVVGGVPAEEGSPPQIDVVVVAARREMISSFLQPLRHAGLDPVEVDLSAFGMIRALADTLPQPESDAAEGIRPQAEAVLYCNVGEIANLAVARGRACLFTRVSHAGLGAIAARLASSRAMSLDHASQWLAHVGLEQPLEGVEGDPEIVAEAREALELGIVGLVDELRLSLDYYRAQEGAIPIERVVLCGPGSAIAGFAVRMEVGLGGLPISRARPPALGQLDERSAARLTLPYGLALEH
ncbi:MAG TPA: type IV pilus assembly protein PilM [Solirubrobacterales bacterium]|jgi:type IV pilus assembly protein PilM|nr:type IV pilus assembly protein PilM [Solirubrobacterales bacterium]